MNTLRHHARRAFQYREGIVRKVSAGLFSLALAATFGLSMASAGNAATQREALASPSVTEPAATSDELPNPAEEKRRDLREEALTKVLNGTAKVEKRGASTVVKLGKKDAGVKGNLKGGKTTKAAATKVDEYVELSREKTDKIFVVL